LILENVITDDKSLAKSRFSSSNDQSGFVFSLEKPKLFAKRTQNSSFSCPTRVNNASTVRLANHMRFDYAAVNHHAEINAAVTEKEC